MNPPTARGRGRMPAGITFNLISATGLSAPALGRIEEQAKVERGPKGWKSVARRVSAG